MKGYDRRSNASSSGNNRRHSVDKEMDETGDLEKLESELKDFGGVADNNSDDRHANTSGRKRERSPEDADIDVPNPNETNPMKMSEFTHLPKQFKWPKGRDERHIENVKGLFSTGHKTQKERYSAEAVIAKYNLKKNVASASLSGSGNTATMNYDKFRGLNNLLREMSCSEFATGAAADFKLRDEIQKCSNLTLTISASHPTFKTFKSLSKSFLVKNYEVDA